MINSQDSEIFSYLSELYSPDWANLYSEYIARDHKTFIRVNLLKGSREELSERLYSVYGITTEPVDGLSEGLLVTSGSEVVGKTLEHILGYYYIQSLSSMLPPFILQPTAGEKVLDLCASPGSKSTYLSELMQNKGTLVLNEIQADRISKLIHNIERMNVVNAVTIHERGEWLSKYYENYFDKILVDAPCSGLGILQKKGEVMNWWTKERAVQLSEIQFRLLVSALKMLKPGGLMLYSTCTLTLEENELNLHKLLAKYDAELLPITLPIPFENGFTSHKEITLNVSLANSKRITPFVANSEGFFVALLKKTGEHPPVEQYILKDRGFRFLPFAKVKEKLRFIINDFGIDPEVFEQFRFVQTPKGVYFSSSNPEEIYLSKFQRFGINFAVEEKTGQFILQTHAAHILAPSITKNKYEAEDSEQLKRYLEGGLIKTSHSLRGQVVVYYRGMLVGTGLVTPEGIKSRFPRSHRTQEILIK